MLTLVITNLGEHFQPVMDGIENESYSVVSSDFFPITIFLKKNE
jgi:hypothetical protein